LADVEICQQFAKRNREMIAEIILGRCGLTAIDAFHTIHNYIDTGEMILRKGAIAAHKGEKVLIPINMRDGSVLAVGKGNPEWNYSAPHGAGRVMSRAGARQRLSLEEYKKACRSIRKGLAGCIRFCNTPGDLQVAARNRITDNRQLGSAGLCAGCQNR